VERRLAGWRPGSTGLDADAMLFTAGLEAGRRGRARLIGPALCGLLTAVSLGLGTWGWNEHTERLALVSRLREGTPAPRAEAPTAVAARSESEYTPSPDGYFSLRRRVERDPDRWLASLDAPGTPPLRPPPPQPRGIRAVPLDDRDEP
jgi:hypothetical protein